MMGQQDWKSSQGRESKGQNKTAKRIFGNLKLAAICKAEIYLLQFKNIWNTPWTHEKLFNTISQEEKEN